MSLSRWLFGKRPEHKGLFVGLDCSGKTTLLYRLKLGRGTEFPTIPTIGFNIETIQHHSGCNFELWDVGDCSGSIRRHTRFYLDDRTFTLFFYDCSESADRQDYALGILKEAMPTILEVKCPHLWIVMNKQDLLPYETREATISENRAKFEAMLKEYDGKIDWEVLDTPGLSGLSGAGVTELIDDLAERLKKRKSAPPADAQPKVPGPPELTEAELVEKIKSLNDGMASAEAFWHSFIMADLPAWDHHTHLRAGYSVLMKAMADGASVLRCAETFLSHLEDLRAANPSKFRNTAHKTMTIFWLFQIRLAILIFQADTGLSTLPSPDDFGDVLLKSPHLMNSGLWKPYYTKDLLFSPEAREAWYPPNLQSLPAVLPTATAPLNSDKPQTGILPETPEVDPDRLLLFGFEVSKGIMASTRPRSQIINEALENLKTATIRLRATNPRIPPYSLTQGYFWIQVFHHARKSMEEARSTTLQDLPVAVSELSFPVLKVAMGIKLDEWRAYYSPAVWESISARMEFAVPDLKPLPSTTVAVNAGAAREMLKVEMDTASRASEKGSQKE